jgi:lipoprotein-releasing system permease protein
MQAWPFEWQVGWRYLRAGRGGRSNRFISFISGVSMLGIALGVAALIVVLSVVNGFQREVRARMLDVIPHVQVDASAAGVDWRTLAQQAQRLDGVAAVAPVVIVRALLGRGETLRGVVLRGVSPADEPRVVPLAERLRDSEMKALQPGARQIVLGAELARELQVKAGDAVVVVSAAGAGETALPRHHGFTVAGVFDSGHHEYDSTLALLHIDEALQLANLPQAQALSVRLLDAQQAPSWARLLAQRLDPRVAVYDWTRSNRIWFAAVAQQKRMLGLILALIIAVAAFNLVATLVMTVTDKRADIAILRTLGASPRSVMAIFMVQGALAGLTGTLAGVLLGLTIALNIETIVPAIERLLGTQLLPGNVYLISQMPSDPQVGDIVPVALVSIGLALLATLYPSWRASRVDPAQALRYD